MDPFKFSFTSMYSNLCIGMIHITILYYYEYILLLLLQETTSTTSTIIVTVDIFI